MVELNCDENTRKVLTFNISLPPKPRLRSILDHARENRGSGRLKGCGRAIISLVNSLYHLKIITTVGKHLFCSPKNIGSFN